MISKKIFYCLLIVVINSIIFFIGKVSNVELRGIFLASIIGATIILIPKQFNQYLYILLIGILITNLIFLTFNTFFGDMYIIKPLLRSSMNVYEQLIVRPINIFGTEFRMRRSTGIADNIHVSAFANLLLSYIAYHKKWKLLFWFSSIVLVLNLNLQFIIVFFLWIFIEKRNKEISIKKMFFLYVPLGLIFLILIDQVFISGSYTSQILSTKLFLIAKELFSYLGILETKTFLFGLPVGHKDFFNVNARYYIPLTDIGIIGIPLQFGVFGLISIVLIYKFWLKYSNKNLEMFLLVCLLTVIHYFSLISFLGIFIISILMKLNIQSLHNAPESLIINKHKFLKFKLVRR